MKLLILTQKVDKTDPILGFFHSWIAEFAKHCEQVTVICLYEGGHRLPANVRVFSLGKERGAGKAGYIFNFYRYIWRERKNYDTVFVHMNPEYAVLGGPLWKVLHKKIALWYVHRSVDLKLRIAASFGDVIFTSTKESFRIESEKVRFVGHGIDPDKFPRADASSGPLSLVHLGRITRIKHIEIISEAAHLLGVPLKLVGPVTTKDDEVYKDELLRDGSEIVIGSNDDASAFAPGAVSVNAAPDGGMDKAVLGSLAAGYPAFASNEAFREVFGEYADAFMFRRGDADDLARKILAFETRPDKQDIIDAFAEKVRREYSVSAVIEKIMKIL